MKIKTTFRPTKKQTQFIRAARWFFGPALRGSGRSTVAAIVAIEQAIHGQEVYLFDPSILLSHGAHYISHRHFRDTVMYVANQYFPTYKFVINKAHNTLRCIQ